MSATNELPIFWLAFCATLLPMVAHAEVLDKEPSLTLIWCAGIAAAGVGIIACRARPYLAIATLPLPALFFVSLIGELGDPSVGAEIVREGGSTYVWSVYAACGLSILGHVVGIALSRVGARRV